MAMPGMSTMPPLTWGSLLHAWRPESGWLAACLLLGGGYASMRLCAGTMVFTSSTNPVWTTRSASTVRPWRVVSFLAGCTLLWVCVASAIGGYAMSLFWMHMVLHLLLIMVVPALFVLGHPLTVLIEALPAHPQARARKVMKGRTVGLLTHPLTGLALYTVVIIGTHLTGFMNEMAIRPWLMTAEQVLYVAAGFLSSFPCSWKSRSTRTRPTWRASCCC